MFSNMIHTIRLNKAFAWKFIARTRHWDFTILFRILDHYDIKQSKNIKHQFITRILKSNTLHDYTTGNFQNVWHSISTIPIYGYTHSLRYSNTNILSFSLFCLVPHKLSPMALKFFGWDNWACFRCWFSSRTMPWNPWVRAGEW